MYHVAVTGWIFIHTHEMHAQVPVRRIASGTLATIGSRGTSLASATIVAKTLRSVTVATAAAVHVPLLWWLRLRRPWATRTRATR